MQCRLGGSFAVMCAPAGWLVLVSAPSLLAIPAATCSSVSMPAVAMWGSQTVATAVFQAHDQHVQCLLGQMSKALKQQW